MYEIYFSVIDQLQFCNKWSTLQYVCEPWDTDMLLLSQKAVAFCKREGWKSGLHVFAFTHMKDFTCKQRAQEICKPDDTHSAWKIGSLLYSVVTSFIQRLFFTWLLACLVYHVSLQVFFLFMLTDVPGSECSVIGCATTATSAMWYLHVLWSRQPCWPPKNLCRLKLLEMK
jgi:hypothetical protein